MCYTDVAGIPDKGETINKVTFRVEAGTSGDLRYGNTGTTAPDLDNNVQKVIWDNIPLGGAVSAVIHCTSLQPGVNATTANPAGAQDFALAWRWEM
jgi:hypothetical protein